MQQEIRVARTAKALVAGPEGLVDQHTIGRQRRRDRGKERTIEVIGHDDAVIAAAEHPKRAFRRARFEIDRTDFAFVAGERTQSLDIAVDGSDGKPHVEQQPGVTPGARREVENPAARPDQRGKAPDPGGMSGLIHF